MGPKKNIDQLIQKFKKKYPNAQARQQTPPEKKKKIKKESKSDKSPSPSNSDKSEKNARKYYDSVKKTQKEQDFKQDYRKDKTPISVIDDNQSDSVAQILPQASQTSFQRKVEQVNESQQKYDPRSIYTSKWAKATDSTMVNAFKHCGFIQKITSFFCSAYIKFRQQSSVAKALAMNGKYFQGKKIRVQRKLKQKPKKKSYSLGNLNTKPIQKLQKKYGKSQGSLPLQKQQKFDLQQKNQQKESSIKVLQQQSSPTPKLSQEQIPPSPSLQLIQSPDKNCSNKPVLSPKKTKISPIRKTENSHKKKQLKRANRSSSKSDEN